MNTQPHPIPSFFTSKKGKLGCTARKILKTSVGSKKRTSQKTNSKISRIEMKKSAQRHNDFQKQNQTQTFKTSITSQKTRSDTPTFSSNKNFRKVMFKIN